MKQSLFENCHQRQWQAFAAQLTQLEQGQAKAADVADFLINIDACASIWPWPRNAATAATW